MVESGGNVPDLSIRFAFQLTIIHIKCWERGRINSNEKFNNEQRPIWLQGWMGNSWKTFLRSLLGFIHNLAHSFFKLVWININLHFIGQAYTLIFHNILG